MTHLHKNMDYSVLMLRYLAIATLFGICSVTAHAEKAFELITHPAEIYGVDNIANGEVTKGVERLETRLGSDRQPQSKRAPVLIDLCVGYTMLKDFEQASQACDQAVEIGWYSGLAYNNRGVLKITQGDYEGAIRDFSSAIEKSGADRVAERNMEHAVERLAAINAERIDAYVADAGQ